jgi:hypothetical protein
MDSYEFLEAQVIEIKARKAEKIAEMVYDWIHENQVTHRRAWTERSVEEQKQYRELASRILEIV